jgi:hypothetical protein
MGGDYGEGVIAFSLFLRKRLYYHLYETHCLFILIYYNQQEYLSIAETKKQI